MTRCELCGEDIYCTCLCGFCMSCLDEFEQFQGCIDIHSQGENSKKISPSEELNALPDTYIPQTKTDFATRLKARTDGFGNEANQDKTGDTYSREAQNLEIADIIEPPDKRTKLPDTTYTCPCQSCTPQKRARCQKPKDFVSRWGVYNYKEILEA